MGYTKLCCTYSLFKYLMCALYSTDACSTRVLESSALQQKLILNQVVNEMLEEFGFPEEFVSNVWDIIQEERSKNG